MSADALVYTTQRARTGRGRSRADGPAAGTIYRLHRESCRYAKGPSAFPVEFGVWCVFIEHARPTDDHLLCKVCKPESADG